MQPVSFAGHFVCNALVADFFFFFLITTVQSCCCCFGFIAQKNGKLFLSLYNVREMMSKADMMQKQ